MIKINNLVLPLSNKVKSLEPFILENNTITAIIGPSGSGKTTLLYLLGLLDDTNNVEYYFNNHLININSDYEKSYFRKHYIGFVFQEHNLLNHLTIKENWILSAQISGNHITEKEISNLLELLDLEKTGNEKIQELSGGQKQRVAIGNALVKNPRLLIMDEPTSALDKENSFALMNLLKEIALQRNMMIVIASHSKVVRENADVVYEIKNNLIIRNESDERKQKDEAVNFKESKFPFVKYVVQYYCKFIKFKASLTLLCSLVFALFVISLNVSDQVILYQQKLLDDLVSTEVIVSNNFNGAYYEEHVDSIPTDLYKKLISLDYIESYLPIVVLNTEIEDRQVHILPYSKSMGLEEFKGLNNIYISFDLAQLLQFNDETMTVSLDVSYNQHHIPIEIEVNGKLKSTYNNKYSNSSYVIYLPEQYFFQIFSRICDMNEFIPNTVILYAESYSYVYQAYQVATSLMTHGTVKCEYVDLESLNASTENFTMYIKYVSASLCIMTLLMLIIIYMRYMMNREYEFCLLRANGLRNNEIRKIMIYDMMIQALLFYIFTFLFTQFVTQKLIYMQFIQNVSYSDIMILILLLSIGALICPTIIAYHKLQKISPAKFLRH